MAIVSQIIILQIFGFINWVGKVCLKSYQDSKAGVLGTSSFQNRLTKVVYNADDEADWAFAQRKKIAKLAEIWFRYMSKTGSEHFCYTKFKRKYFASMPTNLLRSFVSVISHKQTFGREFWAQFFDSLG